MTTSQSGEFLGCYTGRQKRLADCLRVHAGFVEAPLGISDLLDFSIGECSAHELRRICQEAIARGEARDRAKELAWERRFRRIRILLLAAIAVVIGAYCTVLR